MPKPIKLSNNKKRKLTLLLAAAVEHLQRGDVDQCQVACEQIEMIYPGSPDVLHFRGLMALEIENNEHAILLLQHAVNAAPGRANFIASLGNAHFQAGNENEAMACYQKGLQVDKHDIATQLGLAAALMNQDKNLEAVDVLEKARKCKPGDIAVRMGLFQALHALGLHGEARVQLQAILNRDAGNAEAHYGMAVLDVELGGLDSALPHVYAAIQANPFHGGAWQVLADLHHFKEGDEELTALMHMYQQSPEESEMRMQLAFALAKAKDDLSEYDSAFILLKEANAIGHSCSDYDIDRAVNELRLATEFTTPAVIADHSNINYQPCLFVLGMPRSGTSLVEQMLASHPDVVALGERGYLKRAIQQVVGNDLSLQQLNVLPADQCAGIGAHYLDLVKQHAGPGNCFCDKTLNHIGLMGLIHRALPQARFVHVKRHPLDTCLSVFKNNIQGSDFAYGCDLDELGQYYLAYQQAMKHWREVLPEDAFYELQYEQLVVEQVPQTQALLHACGLSWDDGCLNFQQAKHAVQTASAAQVRRPLSNRSVGLWRHYQRQLAGMQYLCADPSTGGIDHV